MNAINAPVQFDFHSNAIRVIADDNGEPWFLANDVCAVLGYVNPRQAIIKNCREGGVSKRYTPTESGIQEMTYINEGNLYRLIIKSRKPEAEPFEAWVCDDVLPTIRKTGQYTQPRNGLLDLQEPPTITKSQAGELFNQVNAICSGSGKIRAELWSRFQNHFKLASYKDLPAEKFDEALAYLDQKRQEYLGGPVDMLYISQQELQARIESGIKAIEGELLRSPVARHTLDLSLTFPIGKQRYLLTAVDGVLRMMPLEDELVMTFEQFITHAQHERDYIVVKKAEVAQKLMA